MAEENQENLTAMLERITNDQTRERYSIILNSFLSRRLESINLEHQLPTIIDNFGLMKRAFSRSTDRLQLRIIIIKNTVSSL